MKIALLILLSVLTTDPLKIRKINQAKKEAREAFQSGDYQTAAEKFSYLIDSMKVKEDELILNRAHARFLLKDTANAMLDYQAALASTDKVIASKAGSQLGVIMNRQGKAEAALDYFKQALKADPANEMARYNYEMLKKALEKKRQEEEKKKQEQQQQQQKQQPQEPSEFAKRLKAQADRLAAERRYGEAYALMMDGLKQDETVAYYQQYIDRIKTVADINK